MYLITCSVCGANLKSAADVLGRTVRCPKCKNPFKVNALGPEELEEALSATSPTVAQPTTQILVAAVRRCTCGYQGPMPKRWAGWVVPVAVIVGIATAGFGLLLLLVPKKHRCPSCGMFFD